MSERPCYCLAATLDAQRGARPWIVDCPQHGVIDLKLCTGPFADSCPVHPRQSAPVVDASRVPTPHRWTAADVRTQALFHAKNAAPVDTVAMLRAYAKLLDATPEAGSPAEDDAKLIEFCEALEIDIDLVNLTLAHVIDKLGGDSEFVPLLRGAFKRLSDQQDAAASLRARPQQEGNR